MPDLYPAFAIPNVSGAEDTSAATVIKAGPLFDYELGDFALDGQNRVVMVDGSDEYTLWVVKALSTQLEACASYPGFGLDAEYAMDQPNREAVQSAIERAITEALSEHPATERVYNFSYDWEGSDLAVRFTVKMRNDLPILDFEMNVVT